ncbi:hypothetical protein L7A49_33155, partial [Achromobacter xylosoxidans]|nr:hypothetical protein [Achromobacter xylosoxidans]
HARKLLHINPQLAALPRVMLPAGLTSRYRVRHADIPGALSTIVAGRSTPMRSASSTGDSGAPADRSAFRMASRDGTSGSKSG